jgi:hypothetical protein
VSGHHAYRPGRDDCRWARLARELAAERRRGDPDGYCAGCDPERPETAHATGCARWAATAPGRRRL